MKKTLFLVGTLLVFAFPLPAQDKEVTEVEPEQFLVLKQGNIPDAVRKTAEALFDEKTQVKWGVFPYQFKDFGWVVNKDYNGPIDHYEIVFKTKEGVDVDAVFESTGELVRYREVNKNAVIPLDIAQAIAKTQYNGWKLVKGTEVVTDKQNKITEHFAVKLENGKQKKTLYFTRKGDLLTNK